MPAKFLKTLLFILLFAVLILASGVIINKITPIFPDNIDTLHLFIAAGVIAVLLAILTNFGKELFLPSKSERPLSFSPEETQKNYATIRQYLLEKRYRPRLQQKLAGDQLFNLRVKPTTEGTSLEKAESFVKTLQGRKTGKEIRQIFEQARRRLLVTGVPGSGKTSLLLHLAIELLETDHENLPAVLNLATWNSSIATLDDWLQEILPAELGVTKRYAADILQQGKLTLLLDGLDEVNEAHRASCIDAIKGYGGKKQKDYVISTRKDEYKALEKDAPVWAQIEVLPLTKTQLLSQLDHADRRDFPEAPDLKAALENDPLLLKVAETPFYLNCLQLLFRGGSTLSEMNFKGETEEARQAEIVERFTEQALAMRSPRGYTSEQVRHWLSFFASRLTQRNKVVFELVDLQYDWWRWSILMTYVTWVLQGFIFWIPSTFVGTATPFIILGLYSAHSKSSIEPLLVMMVVIVICVLIVSLFMGITALSQYNINKGKYSGLPYMSGETYPVIKTKEKLQWTLLRFSKSYLEFINRTNLKEFIIMGFFSGAIFGVIIGHLSLQKPLIALFRPGLETGLIGGIFIWFSIVLLFFPFTILLFGTMKGVFEIYEKNSIPFLQITTPYQRFIASAKALHFSILQHWLLRWQLYRAGVLPLRLVDFLNEMTARHLLESDGATWRFRHRILQEYFAGQWKENDAEKP
ncbi:MAG: NACHT domain-containing protein [Saprospiraceae bacterium]